MDGGGGGARERALDGAMRLFWRRGVAGSSYDDIVAATGLSRKALYAIWADKAALVHEALRLYRDTELAAQLALLEPPGAAGLARFWAALEAQAQGAGWTGCLLFRTAGDEGRHDRAVRALFDAHVAALSQALIAAILASRREPTRARVLDTGAAAMQAVALVALATTLAAGGRGYDARVAEAFRAGRIACGLPPA
jgi:AcrR family transcriptional regulator